MQRRNRQESFYEFLIVLIVGFVAIAGVFTTSISFDTSPMQISQDNPQSLADNTHQMHKQTLKTDITGYAIQTAQKKYIQCKKGTGGEIIDNSLNPPVTSMDAWVPYLEVSPNIREDDPFFTDLCLEAGGQYVIETVNVPY